MNLYRIINDGRMFFRTQKRMKNRNPDDVVWPNEIVMSLNDDIVNGYHEMIVLTQFHGVGFITVSVERFDSSMEKIS